MQELTIIVLAFTTVMITVDGCAERFGFHCLENQWNCPLNFKRTIDRWRCYDDHCCWCRDEGTNFRRLCTLQDVVSTSPQRPILVNPNFDNCNWCPRGFFCAYQQDLGLPAPDNGCSRGARRFFRAFRSKRDIERVYTSPRISYDIADME